MICNILYNKLYCSSGYESMNDDYLRYVEGVCGRAGLGAEPPSFNDATFKGATDAERGSAISSTSTRSRESRPYYCILVYVLYNLTRR